MALYSLVSQLARGWINVAARLFDQRMIMFYPRRNLQPPGFARLCSETSKRATLLAQFVDVDDDSEASIETFAFGTNCDIS